jgi:hypothetical protein
MNDKTQSHDTAEIRSLMAAAFDDVGLIALCLDEFPKLYNSLGRGLRKDEIINVIIDYFQRRKDFTPLLAAVKEREPELYVSFEASLLVEPGLRSIWQQHLKDLADHIAQNLALLKEYEDALRYEDDPRRRTKYLREIGQLRRSLARYMREYGELEAQIVSRKPSMTMQDVAAQLRQMDAILEIRRLRQTLLDHYKADEQEIVAIPVEQLDQANLVTVQAILDALEADQVPDALMRQALDVVQRILVVLSERSIILSGQQAVSDAIAAPTLDVKHKLKLTLPIIPPLLSYESELKLGGEMKLRRRWRRLKCRAYGYDSRLLLAFSAVTALAFGSIFYFLANLWQLDVPQRLVAASALWLAPATVLWVGFRWTHVPTTKMFSSVKRVLAITSALFLAGGIVWTTWTMIESDIQVSPCLELDLVTGTGQEVCPNDNGVIVLASGSLDRQSNLSGRAMLTHANGCTCEWEGQTESNPLKRLHGPTQDCSFSFELPDKPAATHYLTLTVGERRRLFTISVQGQ